MRILYHLPNSPFSRRARLALAHKGLAVELRDARANPEHLEEARRRSPLKTVPVLVEEDGRAIGDSTAISHYLDRVHPAAPLWPVEPESALAVFEVASLVDVALENIVNVGNRYYALHTAENWNAVKDELVGRTQRALDALGERAAALGRPTVARAWSAADMWLYTLEAWLRVLPSRAETYPLARQLVSLGWRLPPSLSAWAEPHRARPDVAALDG